MPITSAPLAISDFGSARLGDPGQRYSGDVMPGVYRAPEIIAGMDWDSKIDIWSIGVMVRALTSLTYAPDRCFNPEGNRYGICLKADVYSVP